MGKNNRLRVIPYDRKDKKQAKILEKMIDMYIDKVNFDLAQKLLIMFNRIADKKNNK